MGIPLEASSGTARLLSVRADPPMPARSTFMTRCSSSTQLPGDARGRLELGVMTLTVEAAQRVAMEAFLACDRERRRRIESPRQQHYARARHLPGTLPHRYLCSWIWNRTGR